MLGLKSILPAAAAALSLGATLLLGGGNAAAAQADTDFIYSGQDTSSNTLTFQTATYSIDGQFGVPGFIVVDTCVPGLLPLTDTCQIDIFPGQVSFKMKLEMVTKAEVLSLNHFQVEGPTELVEGETVAIESSNAAQDAPIVSFGLEGTPKLTIHYDYDTSENGYECQGFGQTDSGDDHCEDIVWEPGQITLMSKNLVLPYSGAMSLEEDHDLLNIPVCEFIGTALGLPGLLDVCNIGLNSEVNATIDVSAGGSISDPGFHAQRDLLAGVNPLPGASSGVIHWPSAAPIADNVYVACGGNPGSTLSYRLQDNSYDTRVTDVSAGFEVKLNFTGALDFIDDITLIDLGDLFALTNAPLEIQASASDYQVALGQYVAEQQPPVIDLNDASPAVGTEGSPTLFSASAEDNCPGNLSFTWNFSDGGVAFGASVYHTFADNGTHSYELEVCDLRQNCATVNGSYVVLNADPIANAGPDALEAWGIQLPFNGQAVDPGSADQGTLSYEWDFGDNSPKGHAEDTTHAYTTPGTYIATLTVCDKDGACDTDSREVTIRKRNTSTGYLGAHTWTYDTEAILSASLVDEFGQPVNGRVMNYSIDGGAVGAANTNSMGIADRSYQVTQVAGNHSVLAAFGGDSLYELSQSNDAAIVVVKATVVTYKGALSGGPNKVITLSAVLKDAQGKPLAGRTISFQLGTQSASATTDANGLATTTLKLSQKQGSYALTTSWTPNATDATKYAAAGDVDTFKLTAK